MLTPHDCFLEGNCYLLCMHDFDVKLDLGS